MSFSVIIPAYNVSGVVERAIRSAAAQTLPPFEILVIDDCSTDKTVEVVQALKREIPSLRLYSTPANGGPAVARNVGLREAKGDWIGLLDADDAWKPERLQRLHEVARATSADFVADDLVMWDAVADAQFKPNYYNLPESQKQITLLDMFRAEDDFNFSKVAFGLMKPICRRAFLVEHKLEYDESLDFAEDLVLYVESLLNGAKIILIDSPYYIYSVPFGRSPHSRTFKDLRKLQRIPDLISNKYGDRIDAKVRRAMNNFRKTMVLLLESDVARAYKRSGQYTRYFTYLAARPELTWRLVSRAATTSIGKRLHQVAARGPQ
jgi:succinoglycan biosynthesis protein ExoO